LAICSFTNKINLSSARVRSRCRGRLRVSVDIGVTGDLDGDERMVSCEESGGNGGFIPLRAVEPGLAENFLGPNAVFDEGVAEEGDVVRGAVVFVFVVLVGLGRRQARRDTRRVSAVTRSIRGIPMAVPELTSAGGLNFGQSDRFVIV
jgi:hypothetical protein